MPAKIALVALLALAVVVPSASAQNVGPDYVASDNVELVNRIKTVGDGVGGRVVGDYLYITSTKSLSIFDIKTNPEAPRQIGLFTLDIEFENEEVPTNGKVLGISGQIGCADPTNANVFAGVLDDEATGCLTLYDVSDPENVKRLSSIAGAGQHTSACVYDCKWMMGSTGAVSDTSDPANAKYLGDWEDGITSAPGVEPEFDPGCHHLREIQPGIILGSCQPMVLMSIRPEDGASPLKPKVLATGTNQDERFIHSSRWPREGEDRFMISGGETNASPVCDDTVGALMVWDAKGVGTAAKPKVGGQFKLLDEIRPINGSYADGHSPVNGLGCSVHWFQEHPAFKNGGVIANAQYENGTRILQVTPEGKIVEQGYFLPLGGSTSSPLWHPNGKVVYSVDYARGVDVLRYTGPTYVPDASGKVPDEPGTTPGTGGPGPGGPAAPCASAAGFKSAHVRFKKNRALRFAPKFRQRRKFDVSFYRQSRGRNVLKKSKVVKSFRGRTKAFTWKGARRLGVGSYYARFTMKLPDGSTDLRRVALRRAGNRFKRAKRFFQLVNCGVFERWELSGSVFGGPKNRPLKISYRLARGANQVGIIVRSGKKVIKRLRGPGVANKTFSVKLPARSVKRGKIVSVQATADTGQKIRSQVVFAKRL